jgi:hypothetical protein
MALKRYDLDPCTSVRASVPAAVMVCPPENGIEVAPRHARPGLVVWMNPPFSDVAPWFELARLLADVHGLVWGIVPHAPNIKAWRTNGPDYGWPLGRVAFDPPPGVTPSTPAQEHDLVLWRNVVNPAAGTIQRVDAHPRTLYSMRRACGEH